MSDRVTEAVRQQYEAFAYPTPVDDIAKHRIGADPSIASAQLWPSGRPRDDLRILSAGCGTHQAALLAFHNPNCSVVGIDLSAASMAHEEQLRTQHDLQNLTLRRMSLLDVGSLQQQFDYIVCTGVLHHMPDPDAGLRALSDVLAPNGRMYLMLYGAAGRAGVYFLQDALRRMGLKQTPEDITLAKATLRFAPNNHFAAQIVQRSGDELKGDAAFVDTFLHSQDRAYSAPEVFAFLDRGGLSFAGWLDNGDYFPDRFVTGEVLARLQSLPEVEQFAIVEHLILNQLKHEFFACRPDQKAHLVSFSGSDWIGFVPRLRYSARATGGDPTTWKIVHQEISTPLTAPEALVLSEIDGNRRISDIIEHQSFASNPYAKRLQFAREFFSRMWRLGHLVYAR